MYIWVDGIGEYFCCKMRIVSEELIKLEDFFIWNFDGFSIN